MNSAKMTAQWNPPTPIEDLFLQLCEGQLFATEESEMIDGIPLLRHEQDDSYPVSKGKKGKKNWPPVTTDSVISNLKDNQLTDFTKTINGFVQNRN